MNKTIRRTVDQFEGDQNHVQAYTEAVRNLCGMVEECMETNKVILLSPVLRQLVRDHARKVEKMREKIGAYLTVDNLHAPLELPQ
jgi:hypothetical protein